MQAPLLALSLPGCNVTDAVMQAMWESGPAAADTQDALSASSLLFQPQGDPLRVTHSESTQQETRIECSQSFLLKQQQPRPAVILAEGLRCLEFLDLAATQVSSAGLSAVLAGAPALTHLLLSACGNVRGEALLAAVRAGLAKRLLFVETTGCPGVRVDVIQALFAEGIACNTSAPYQA